MRTCSDAIHASGNRPSANNSRSHSASWRSVLARRLRPRSARVSTVSARCATPPARCTARATNSQPVQASIATCTSRPANDRIQASTASGVDPIRPRDTSPVRASTQSNVIWRRCTSNPATTASADGAAIARESLWATDDIPSLTVGTSVRLAARAGAIRVCLKRRSTRRTGHLHPVTDLRIARRSCHLVVAAAASGGVLLGDHRGLPPGLPRRRGIPLSAP